MTKKIIDLVLEKDYISLKSVLEERVAAKLKDKIESKKKDFVEKMKASKKNCALTESDHSFSEKLYTKLNDLGYKNHGGMIPLGDKYKVMIDVTGKDVEVQVLKGTKASTATSMFFDTTPITKGLDHASAFVAEIIKSVILPDYKAEKEKAAKKGE